MTDPQKEAREIAARHGVKAYAPPADTGKQEPVCECRVRSALGLALDMISTGSLVPAAVDECRAALSDPCSCEQSALGWQRTSDANRKQRQEAEAERDSLHDQLVQSQAEALNGKELLAGKVLTIQQLREQNEGLRAAVRNQARTISELQAECEQLREKHEAELAEAREYAAIAMRGLDTITESADELATLLREHWKAPAELDVQTLYCVALLAGFASAWEKNPPENGIVHAVKFAAIGTLEIQIRRIDGKTAADSLRELTAELAAARSLLEEARLALKPFETHYLRMEVPPEDYSYMKERIKDWFGVSDFAGAAAALAKIEASRREADSVLRAGIRTPVEGEKP